MKFESLACVMPMAICVSSYNAENYAIVIETGGSCLSNNEADDTFKFEGVSSSCSLAIDEYIKYCKYSSRLIKSTILSFVAKVFTTQFKF